MILGEGGRSIIQSLFVVRSKISRLNDDPLAKIEERRVVSAYRLAFDNEMKSFVYIRYANFDIRARVYIKVSIQCRSKYRNMFATGV